MNRLLVLALVFSAAGCTAASHKYVAIPVTGQPPAQVQADVALCETSTKADMDANVGTAILAAGWIGYYGIHDGYQQAYKDCMTARGYTFSK